MFSKFISSPLHRFLQKKRFAETLIFAAIFIVGLIFSAVHLLTTVVHESYWNQIFLLIPVSLMLIGFLGFGWLFWEREISAERKAAKKIAQPIAGLFTVQDWVQDFPTIPDSKFINESPGTQLAYRLPVSQQAAFEHFGAALFCVVWNVVSWSILLYSLYYSAATIADFVSCIIFGIVFCGFGLFLVVMILHHLMTLFGIGPTILEISDHPVYAGRRFRLMFTQYGVFRANEFEILIVCEESARFRQGTDTITSRKEVYRQRLLYRKDFETTQGVPMQHEFVVRLPAGAMHSMRSEHNEVQWKIVVRAQLLGWLDLFRESHIVVYPAAITERR